MRGRSRQFKHFIEDPSNPILPLEEGRIQTNRYRVANHSFVQGAAVLRKVKYDGELGKQLMKGPRDLFALTLMFREKLHNKMYYMRPVLHT